jgi:hypothetical protein
VPIGKSGVGSIRAVINQSKIYDQRYTEDGYDNRSAVRVLTSEQLALANAMNRAIISQPDKSVLSLLDYGYGTGRVTNEFILNPIALEGHKGDLRVVAYDVSRVGLEKAISTLRQHGFEGPKIKSLNKSHIKRHVMGHLSRTTNGATTTCYFVLGHENDPLANVKRYLTEANFGEPFTLTSSWYSGIGHTPGREARLSIFRMLGEVTHPQGEVVITISATGDPVDGWQQIWHDRLGHSNIGESPLKEPGDMLYETEIPGLFNFYHVYSTDFIECMEATRTKQSSQRCWVESIRFPGPEFASSAEEQTNYVKVDAFNQLIRGRAWVADDFSKVHTVGGFRSSINSGSETR